MTHHTEQTAHAELDALRHHLFEFGIGEKGIRQAALEIDVVGVVTASERCGPRTVENLIVARQLDRRWRA